MKALILLFTMLVAPFSHSQSFGDDMGGEITLVRFNQRSSSENEGRGKFINFDESEVEAIITKDEIYIRPADLQDGIERVEGVRVENNLIQLDFNRPNFNLDRVLMNSGKVMRVLSGGTDGGGT